MPPVGFEPTIPAGERPQTYALERAAIGTGMVTNTVCYSWIQRYSSLSVQLYTHLNPMPELRMSGALPPFPIGLYVVTTFFYCLL
jgi:hypothetical protein